MEYKNTVTNGSCSCILTLLDATCFDFCCTSHREVAALTDGTVTQGWRGGVLTVQTNMKNGSRNRYVISVNYEKQVAYFVQDKSKL